MQRYPEVFDTIPDPIFLINGKHLVTENTVARQGRRNAATRVFQTVNWLIREELEKLPQYGFDPAAAGWRNERKPRRSEAWQLKEPLPVNGDDGVEVEWFYTYVTNDGQASNVEWIEKTLLDWEDAVWKAGIDGCGSARPRRCGASRKATGGRRTSRHTSGPSRRG